MGGNKETSIYSELEQVAVRRFYDIQIKDSACHFFHTQSESAVMKEFLKPLWLSQLFPKPRAEAPGGAIHYLTEREEERKTRSRRKTGRERRQTISVIFTRCSISLIIKFLLFRLLRKEESIMLHKMSSLVMLMIIEVWHLSMERK